MSAMADHAPTRPTNPSGSSPPPACSTGTTPSINIMRRILQSQGAEVIHLGHNRSVDEVVTAAVQEDVQGVAVSSYQGGHVEYFQYLVDLLRERGAGHVKVYGGGGGVIVPDEIARLHEYGVARIFSPHDGHELGLVGMITSMVEACDVDLAADLPASLDGLVAGEPAALARVITGLEAGRLPEPRWTSCARWRRPAPSRCWGSPAPVARASRRSPTSWCAASGSTSRTS